MIHQFLRFALAFGFIFTVSRAQAADEIPAALKAQAKVTQEQASKTALAKVPNGKITSAELEKENGKLIWSFDIATKGKHVTEVQVDAKSGAIISSQAETPEEQAKEAAAEKKEKNSEALVGSRLDSGAQFFRIVFRGAHGHTNGFVSMPSRTTSHSSRRAKA